MTGNGFFCSLASYIAQSSYVCGEVVGNSFTSGQFFFFFFLKRLILYSNPQIITFSFVIYIYIYIVRSCDIYVALSSWSFTWLRVLEGGDTENYATLTCKMLRSINPNFFCVNEFCVSFLSMSTWFLMLLKSLITYFYVIWLKSMNVCKPRNNWSILINFVEMVCECVFISYLFLSFLMEKV